MTLNQYQKRHTAMVLVGIEGAYNACKRASMDQVLTQVRILRELRRWIWDFMTDKEIRPRREGTTGDTFVIKEGLPQGSPLSPILFTILLSDIGKTSHKPRSRRMISRSWTWQRKIMGCSLSSRKRATK